MTLRRVDGRFHRTGKGRLLRTNPVEAEAVVEEVRRRFEAEPDSVPSLGVVTFNQQQRAYVEALLRDLQDERITNAMDSRGEGLFVKNLENVQGDERDVILFSTAFSVNERGVLPLNFGPLNRAGGQRRLNVAVTRARKQVIVFSSFDPEQLRAEETGAVGIKHLRDYLDQAAGSTEQIALTARSSAADRHVMSIARALRAEGLVVATDVGLSEFRVDISVALPAAPHRPVMAVLCDGPRWAGRGTVGDRDGLPTFVLSSLMRWPTVERVWLPAWLADSEREVVRLVRAAQEAAVARPEPPTEPRLAMPLSGANSSDPGRIANGVAALAASRLAPAAARALPGEEPFQPWQGNALGSREVLDRLPEPAAARLVARALEDVVLAEGPVQVDRLARLVASRFGLTRVNGSRTTDILGQLDRRLLLDPTDGFAWPTSRRPSEWDGFRRASPHEPRPVDQVSLRELGNAAVALCRISAGMQEDELLRETLAIFGGRRLTPAILERVTEALDLALHQRRLTQEGDVYRAAS